MPFLVGEVVWPAHGRFTKFARVLRDFGNGSIRPHHPVSRGPGPGSKKETDGHHARGVGEVNVATRSLREGKIR